MARRSHVLVPITISAVVVGVIGLAFLPSDSKLESVEFPRGTVMVDGIVLEVQIADTGARQTRGLMFQDELPGDQGMLFVFSEPAAHSLWMQGMQFPLDMMWFDGDGRLVHVEKDVPPCKTVVEITTCPSIIPSADALYVLEVTAGFVDRNGVTGDSVLTIISA